jgi:DNA-binding response OmpR family regulator
MNPAVTNAAWSYVLDDSVAVLVVDDDPILREFASVHLSTPTARVETAANGDAAFRLLKRSRFDVVLVDIEMPVLDGFALLGRIRSEPDLRHLPVIMLTGHDDVISIDRSYKLGATAFASKPVNWRQLSYEVRYVLRAARMESELRHAELASRETLHAFQQQCRDGLAAILHRLEACRAGNAVPAPVMSEIEQIEAATRALRLSCDEQPPGPSMRTIPSPSLASA